MNMKIINSKKMLCPCCMNEHDVKTVRIPEEILFKDEKVNFEAEYQYCDLADDLYMDEDQIRINDIAMKNEYRKAHGLLTSNDICEIRLRYGISQTDLCTLLGWGAKTITRYESHQIQDHAHDTILKKLNSDPQWFLTLLEDEKENFPEESYRKYYEVATDLCDKEHDEYLRRAIEARYAKYRDNMFFNGNVILSLDKVVDAIRYFSASRTVKSLFKVKLMKLLWYSDALSYKKRGHAITGLVYQALPMGAVPIAHESIIDLKDIPCEEVDMGETNAYYFNMQGNVNCPALSADDIRILDIVIKKFGGMSRKEIVDFMHKEQAYIETAPYDIIQFKYADSLNI